MGDCLDVLPTLEPQSVDAVICDLPYGVTACKWDSVIPFDDHVHERGRVWYEAEFLLYYVRNGFTHQEAMSFWNERKRAGMWTHLKRIIKPRGAIVLFGSQPFTSALVMSNPKMFKYEWVWRKNRPTLFQHANKMPLRKHENIVVFAKSGTVYNPQFNKGNPYTDKRTSRSRMDGMLIGGAEKVKKPVVNIGTRYPTTDLYYDCEVNRTHLHPTQKPLALMEYLVKTYTNEGNTVLDFTMGSGTTGHACANTGRRFIGIERDPGYFATAQQRIAGAYDPLLHMTEAVS